MNFILNFLGFNAPKDALYERHKKDGMRALYTYLVIYLVIVVASIISSILGNQRIGLGNYALSLNFIAAVIAILMNRADKPYQGVWIAVIVSAAASIIAAMISPLTVAQAIILAAMQLLLILGVALLSLPARLSERAIGFTTAAQFICILIETNSTVREQPSSTTVVASLIVAVVSWIVGIGFIAFNFARYPLRTKLIFGFFGVTLIPLTILGTVNTINSSQTINQFSTSDLQKAAQLTKFTVDSFISGQLHAIRTDAQIKDFVDYLELPADTRVNTPQAQNARQILQSLGRRDLLFLNSYSLLDDRGLNVLDTDEKQIGTFEGDQPYFQEVIRTGLPYVSQIVFLSSALEPDLYFSAPLRNSHEKIIGVLRARFNGSILQNLVVDAVPPTNENDPLYVVMIDNENYIRLAHTTHPEFLYSSYKELSDQETKRLTALKLLPEGRLDRYSIPQPDVITNLQNMQAGVTETFTVKKAAESGDDATTVAVRLEKVPWTVIAQQSSVAIQQPVTQQTRSTVQLAILLAGIGVAAAFFVSQVLASPVVQLTNTVKSIQAGNLDARASIQTPDEIGELAEAFNTMTGQLQDTLLGLEQRVTDRTTELQLRSEELSQQTTELEKRSLELEEANIRIERRAAQVLAISEVARAIASLQNTEELLPYITQLISKQFGFYHVGIFLLDVNKQYAILRAANSEGGQRMLERGHRLQVGKVGIVGNVSETGEPRIALNTGEDAIYFNNPDLPNTHSEMALPLKARDRIIGVLDVQSTEQNAFTQEDIQVLATLADQVSIAIENSRLFEETQKSLAEVEALYRRYLGTQWQRVTEGQQASGYHSTMTGTVPLNKPISRPEYDESLQTGNVVIKVDEDDMSSLVVPIKIRGQALGIVSLRQTGDKEWSEDEISLVQAIAERAAISAENARLFEQTTERAERERKVSEITSKIRSTNNPDEMIQIALNELKQALNIKDARILPYKPPQSKDQG